MVEERLPHVLGALHEALEDLDRYADEIPYPRLLHDRDASRMVRQALQEAIQAAIDAGEMLLVRAGARAPSTYREVFTGLHDRLGLPAPLSDAMERAAGLRNVLVHVYTIVDLERIYAAYTTHRPRLHEFARWAAERAREASGGDGRT